MSDKNDKNKKIENLSEEDKLIRLFIEKNMKSTFEMIENSKYYNW
jgi:hypothetical protein